MLVNIGKSILLLFIGSIFYSCFETKKNDDLFSKQDGVWVKPDYAKGFVIFSGKNYKKIFLLNQKDTIKSYTISRGKNGLNNEIIFPIKKVASLSSIYSYMIYCLGKSDKISGVDNLDYICNDSLRSVLIKGKTQEVAKYNSWDVEKIIRLAPDLIFTWGNSSTQSIDVPDLISKKYSIVFVNDHLEEHPLARAEWIKYIACFFDESTLADSLFSSIEKRYQHIRNGVDPSHKKPSVLTEIKLNEGWFVPGGNSYMAKLIADAGGNYLWAEDKKNGSLCLSFEEVYKKGREADYWINLPMIRSKEELLSRDSRYANFNSFRSGLIFNNDARMNSHGGNSFWEEGIVFPDKVLYDLQLIFKNRSINNDSLYFYRRLN